MKREHCRREIRDKAGNQGCQMIAMTDGTIECEFKNGKGRSSFRIPFEDIEKEAADLRALTRKGA